MRLSDFEELLEKAEKKAGVDREKEVPKVVEEGSGGGSKEEVKGKFEGEVREKKEEKKERKVKGVVYYEYDEDGRLFIYERGGKRLADISDIERYRSEGFEVKPRYLYRYGYDDNEVVVQRKDVIKDEIVDKWVLRCDKSIIEKIKKLPEARNKLGYIEVGYTTWYDRDILECLKTCKKIEFMRILYSP